MLHHTVFVKGETYAGHLTQLYVGEDGKIRYKATFLFFATERDKAILRGEEGEKNVRNYLYLFWKFFHDDCAEKIHGKKHAGG